MLTAPVQHQCAGPVGYVALGDAGRLEHQVAALLPQAQQLAQLFIFGRRRLHLPQLLLQLRDLLPQLVVLLLQGLHVLKPLANAADPASHGGTRRTEGRGDHAQGVVQQPRSGAQGRHHAQHHRDGGRRGQQPYSRFRKKSLHVSFVPL